MSKPLELRKISRADWAEYLVTCHEIGADDPQELLSAFITTPDLVRSAMAVLRQQKAQERSEDRRVVSLGRHST